jgi:YVTN family beta-propeller protein
VQNAYITNQGDGTVSVIDTATNTVIGSPIAVGFGPSGVAVTPDGSTVYVANGGSPSTVSVIATATNTVTATIPVGTYPEGVAVTPDGSKVYVTNDGSNSVSVIATATITVTTTITVGTAPFGVAVTPDASKVYVANFNSKSVSVIATATNTVTTTVTDPSFNFPVAFGVFIQPAIPFSSLSAELVIAGGHHPAFALNAFFGLGAGSTGINPPAQPVTLRVGPYTATIPAGSFHQLASGRGVTVWAASETINSVSLALDILSLGHNSYQFGAAAQPVNLTAVPNPVPVSLSIGNNSGSTSVNATRVPRLAATGP